LQKQYPTTGHSADFISFIASELQPMIQARYKTTPDKYLIGQSLGGLLATEILLRNAQLFTHYLIVSPSLWWDNESMLNEAEVLFAQQPDTDRYVFVAVGAHEDKIMQREAMALAEMLKRSKKKHLKTDFLSMEEENHATILHNCIYEAFLKLFPYKD
jgi:predicted alpha/beta superfamily hydrolase